MNLQPFFPTAARRLTLRRLTWLLLAAMLVLCLVGVRPEHADALSSVNYLFQWGSSGSGDGQFSSPYGVAVDASGNVYVVDEGNSRIQKFDSNGTYLTQWGSLGSGDGQFSRPIGVAVDGAGNVYVADADNNRVQKFDSNGTYLTQWGSSGSGDGQFNSPSGVAVDTAGNVYVTDTGNNRVQKFDSNGTYLAQWGGHGSGNGQFDTPSGVAVDAAGNVYVTEAYNYRVQKFDSSGTYLTQWGTYGGGDGQFYSPTGVAVDAAGNIYVADSSRVQEFDSNGTYLAQFGSFGSGDGQFQSPQGIAINAVGYIYVADRDHNRVEAFGSDVFSLDDASPDDGDLITDTKTVADLLTGSYTFTEMDTAGWELTNITCDTGNWSVNGNSLTVDLAAGENVTCTVTNNLVPANQPPVANPGGPYLGAVNTPIQFDGSGSSDPDGDSLTYAWNFGDGNNGIGATPTHAYTAVGIYNVCLTVNDGSLDSEPVCTMAVVYDPSAGFVTGGGWIDSPAGAYTADPSLTGKATFGFVSKYKKGASIPTGNTEFQFKAGDFNFHSDTYEWLVVNQGGTNAQFKGSGTVNGWLAPNGDSYKFMLWAGDGSPDTFRIKIWWEDNGVETVVYDNGTDQAIGGGNIVVHKSK